MTSITVIIPSYNDLAGVLNCLNSLQAMAAFPHRYLVSDDCSPAVYYPALVPRAVADVCRNEVNLGFAGNCNMAAAVCDTDVLLFINQDVYAIPGWSEGWDAALLAAFNDPCVGIVGARLLFPDGSVQSAGGTIDAACQPVHRCLGWTNPHHPDVATPRGVSWVTGAAMAVRRDVLIQLGGFDTAYRRGYWEDVDLCIKAREAGYQVLYEPRCTLVHSVGSTGGNPDFTKNALLWKSRWVDTGKVTPEVTYQHVRYW